MDVQLAPTDAQLGPTSDEGVKLLCREGSEQRCCEPERWIFLTQLFKLVNPNVMVLHGHMHWKNLVIAIRVVTRCNILPMLHAATLLLQ
jgi:hypothetical protein